MGSSILPWRPNSLPLGSDVHTNVMVVIHSQTQKAMSKTPTSGIIINQAKGEMIITGKTILDGIKNNQLDGLEDILDLGKGKGEQFEPHEGEIFVFPPFEEIPIVVRVATLDSKNYKILHGYVQSLRSKTYKEIPMTLFRRVPGIPSDIEKLKTGYPLTEELIDSSLSDLTRLRTLCGHKVLFEHILTLPRQEWGKDEDGKRIQLDVENVPLEKRHRPMKYFQVKFNKD